ncbi:hypothetical protein HpMS170_09400 [Helicobacter pylori]
MRQKNPFEGKNEKHLSNATQKAHAIFYVTKKPTPPQKGEERKERTIEKSKNNLIRKQRYIPYTTKRLLTQEL